MQALPEDWLFMSDLDLPLARRLVLAAQGLSRTRPFGRGREAVLTGIKHLGYIQIDAISIVARAHLHTLWSRTDTQPESHLYALQNPNREIFEYWAHAAAYLPMRDFRYALPLMHHIRQITEAEQKSTEVRKLKRQIMAHVRAGICKARDFEAPAGYQRGNWWQFKPAKHMLNMLYMRGELMISHREGFEKLYALPEQVLPGDINTRSPSLEAQAKHMLFTTLQAQGIATAEEITYPLNTSRWVKRKALRAKIPAMLNQLTRQGVLLQKEVAGQQVYLTPAHLESVPQTLSSRTRILSPFDNLVIQRNRLRRLFHYNYSIECYLPAHKRRYGYFCLPILRKDRFLGRLDALVERECKNLQLVGLHLEEDVKPDHETARRIARAIRDFARFNRCDSVQVIRTRPGTFRKKITTALSELGY